MENKLNTIENNSGKSIVQKENNYGEGCQRVYSKSQQKVVDRCDTRSGALTYCSSNFTKVLTSEGVSAFKTLDNLEQFREFAMKQCMEEKGYEY